MSDPVFTYDVFLSHRAKDKAVVRGFSLSASNRERIPSNETSRFQPLNRSRRRQSALISFGGRWRELTSAATRFMERAGVTCRSPRLVERLRAEGLKVWFDEWGLPVAASRQSAANSSADQTCAGKEDGGALPSRRYAEKIEEGLLDIAERG